MAKKALTVTMEIKLGEAGTFATSDDEGLKNLLG